MKGILYLSLLLLAQSCFLNTSKDVLMPNFNLLLADSVTVLNTSTIQKGKPNIFIFFSPDCEHCQAETENILKNMDSLKKVHFYFVTIDPVDRMKVFNSYYKLSLYENVTVGKDIGFIFPKMFKGEPPPYSLIYDRNKNLKAVFKGQMTASDFIRILKQI